MPEGQHLQIFRFNQTIATALSNPPWWIFKQQQWFKHIIIKSWLISYQHRWALRSGSVEHRAPVSNIWVHQLQRTIIKHCALTSNSNCMNPCTVQIFSHCKKANTCSGPSINVACQVVEMLMTGLQEFSCKQKDFLIWSWFGSQRQNCDAVLSLKCLCHRRYQVYMARYLVLNELFLSQSQRTSNMRANHHASSLTELDNTQPMQLIAHPINSKSY
jgi:hypothetical protein